MVAVCAADMRGGYRPAALYRGAALGMRHEVRRLVDVGRYEGVL